MEINAPSFNTISGNSPYLISAPHVHIHKRPNLTGTYRTEEVLTDRICIDICKEVGASGIYLTGDVDYDPNFHKFTANEYKQKVRDIVRGEKKEIFLDIHGLSEDHQYDIGIYYLSHFGKSKSMAKELRRFLDSGELKDISIQIFRFFDNDQETLSEFAASKLRIPALQIEVAKYIREDEVLRNALVKNIVNFLNSY